MASTSTFDTVHIDIKQAFTKGLDTIKPYLHIQTAMHATLVLCAILTAGSTAVLAFPSRGSGQRPMGSTAHPSHSSGWDTSFDTQCKSEGYFPSPTSCRQFYRCTSMSGQSSELVRYQFECPADQIYCKSQIACVHPWACAEECHIPKDKRERVGMVDHMKPRGGGKQCPPFKCQRPGTFTDPHECGKFHECESYFGEGELKLLDTVGECPRGEVFCPIVGACGAEEACPQRCDRSCQ